jgi:hypothetical protein
MAGANASQEPRHFHHEIQKARERKMKILSSGFLAFSLSRLAPFSVSFLPCFRDGHLMRLPWPQRICNPLPDMRT